MTTACSSFFTLPDLLLCLPPFLSQHELIRLLQTNHCINNICTPVFWQTVSAQGILSKRLLDSPEGLQAFSNNVGSIQSINWPTELSWYYMNALWIYLNSSACSPGHKAIPTDALSHPKWGQLTTPDNPPNLIPMPPMLRLTDYTAYLSSIYQVEEHTYRPTYSYDTTQKPHQHQLLWLIRLNRTTLTRLSLSRSPMLSVRLTRDFCRTISQLDHLQILELIDPLSWTPLTLQVIEMLFFSCPASLVEFTLSGEIGEVMEDMDMDPKQSDWDLDQGLLALRQEPLYHLKAIELPRVDIEVASLAPLFCSILEQCPAVEKLTLPFLRDLKAMHAISKTVGDCCPSISDLVVPSSWHNKNDEALMAVTGGIQVQRLERIRIGWFLDQPSSNLSAAVFARHSDTLRQIEFFNCRRIFSNTIQVILVTCRALEILKVQKSSIENSRRNCLMLEAAVLKEWVCTRIRNLAIIVEFAPDGRGPKYLNDPTKATWTEEDHHHYRMLDKFYTQIGSLTQLEVLTMQASGFNTLHCKRSHGKIPFRETCLPGLLALEDEVTGQIGFLSRWAGLRKLRDLRGSFSVTTKEAVARMGEREVDWLVTHLPALRTATLLFLPQRGWWSDNDVPDIVHKIQQRRPGLDLIEFVQE